MRLDRAVAKFAKNEVWGWNQSLMCFELTGVKGSFWVYDKFISDRTFGTKKRILNTPRQEYIPSRYEYVRVGDSIARFMVDSLNEDIYSNSPYANSYLLREAKYLVEIGSLQGAARASGVGGKTEFTVESSMFGDYERYTSSGSTEFDTVDYTVSDIFLPLSAEIDSTKIVRIDGKLYEITEVSRVSNLLWVRGQKLSEDAQVTVQRHTLFECDLSNRWDVIDYLADVGGQVTVTFSRPCQTRLIQVGSDPFTVETAFACAASSQEHYELALYDADRNLLDHSHEGSLYWTGSAVGPFILAVVPAHFQDAGSVVVNFGAGDALGGYGEEYGLYYGATSFDEHACDA